MEDKNIENFLRSKYEFSGFNVDKLAGDASDRKFYRVTFNEPVCSGSERAVLMVLEQPWTDGELPYLNVRVFMEKAGLPVPALYHADLASGLILIEDYGDATLEDAIRNAPAKTEDLYKLAVDLMLRIQIEGAKARDESCMAFSLSFDVEKLMFEFNFFYEHAIMNYKCGGVAHADESIIQAGFQKIAETLAAEPRYLTHRDYHSRNLMVTGGGELGLVDFQDARLGPLQYDLVSLLLDSYVKIPDALIVKLYEYYLDRLERVYGMKQDRAGFDKIYDYMAIQRSIKAAGSFAYLDCVKKKDRYLKYFAPCLARVGPAASKHAELAPFIAALSKYVEEIG
ncbi:MAG: phosphotransferase [bacterium]